MSPAHVLLEELAAARQAGRTFESAFPDALAAALAAAARDERACWCDALCGTVEGWRASWERRPATRAERALALLGDGSDRVPLPERPCARCGAQIAAHRGRRGTAKYCSDACRRAASNERVTAAVG